MSKGNLTDKEEPPQLSAPLPDVPALDLNPWSTLPPLTPPPPLPPDSGAHTQYPFSLSTVDASINPEKAYLRARSSARPWQTILPKARHHVIRSPIRAPAMAQANSSNGTPAADGVFTPSSDSDIHELKMTEKRKLLKEWIRHMQELATLHIMCHAHYARMAIGIMVPSILLSIGSGAANLMTGGQLKCEKSDDHFLSTGEILSIILGIMSLLSASLSTIYHFLRLSERQQGHLNCANQFDKLARQIKVQSILTETDERTYVNLAEFIKDISDEFDNLTDSMPYIPEFINQKYIKISKLRDVNNKKSNDCESGYACRVSVRPSLDLTNMLMFPLKRTPMRQNAHGRPSLEKINEIPSIK